MVQVQAVLIDAMGTLVGLAPPAPRLRAALAGGPGLGVSLAEAEVAVAAEIAFYRSHMQEGRDPESVTDLRARCAAVLLSHLPARVRDRLSVAAATELLLASLHFNAFPDALPALSCLRRRGIRVVVVSNWDASLEDVLEEVGLAVVLDAVLTSAVAGAAKPAPEIFQRALELADVPAERAVHVGDSVIEDVRGARAAGLAAVWLNRSGASVPAGVVAMSTLEELNRPPWSGRP